VSLQYRALSQKLRLSQAALELRTFTVSELESLTGINENTIYGVLAQLGAIYIQSKDLPSHGLGRPRKRYCLTEAGVAMLAAQNARILVSMRDWRLKTERKVETLREEILKLPVEERMILIEQVRQSVEEAEAGVEVVVQDAAAAAAAATAVESEYESA
jgi:DNA-binding PadR family transcriptional regulator